MYIINKPYGLCNYLKINKSWYDLNLNLSINSNLNLLSQQISIDSCVICSMGSGASSLVMNGDIKDL